MATAPAQVDYTERVIAQAHKDLDELAREMRQGRLWCKIQILVDGEDGRAISLDTGIHKKRLARNL